MVSDLAIPDDRPVPLRRTQHPPSAFSVGPNIAAFLRHLPAGQRSDVLRAALAAFIDRYDGDEPAGFAPIFFRLAPGQDVALDVLAERFRTTRSALVERALGQHVLGELARQQTR